MNTIKRQIVSKLEQDLIACEESTNWIRRTRANTVKSLWKSCQHPDWLIWLIGKLACKHPYYRRAGAAAMAACIDVLLEREHNLTEEEVKFVLAISTQLDRFGQTGKRPRKLPDWEEGWGMADRDLNTLLYEGQSLLNDPTGNAPVWCGVFMGTHKSSAAKLRRTLCNEIRRVVECPTLKELEQA